MPAPPQFDVTQVTPQSLREAGQRAFMKVVDAELKRDQRGAGRVPVPEWISHALRTEHLDRWHAMLDLMLTQALGRLRVLDEEWLAAKPELSGPELNRAEAEYHSARLRTQRFRAVVEQALAEADSLYDSRLTYLEQAIRTHRDEVEADDSIEPSTADKVLWKALDA